jgi:uncharacterized protein YkwD
MAGKCWSLSLLGALMLTPIGLYGQSTKQVQSERLQRPSGDSASAKSAPGLARVNEEILSATNEFRRQNGRGELKVNQKLTEAARYFADFMARTDKYSHTADGKEPWERVAKYGYAYCIVLENIAYENNPEGFGANDLAQAFMKGWKKSPPHRKNLLDADVDEIGVGVAYSARTSRYYAVQDFGRPKSKEIVFTITNETNSPVKFTVDGKELSLDPRYTIRYEQCRPSEVRFESPKAKEAQPQSAAAIRPRNGGHYVIRQDGSGNITVKEERRTGER